MKDRGKHAISRYDDRGAAKTPRSSFGNDNPKKPRGHAPDYGGTFPLWAFRIVDLGGPWCWTNMDGRVLGEVLKRLKQLESMPWLEIERGTGSHFVEDHSRLCKEARDRLVEIEQDDTETLFSLRLTGRKRIWGIRDQGVLRFLWWDPEHEVYPSEKKHT